MSSNKLGLYVIKDKAVGTFGSVMCFPNEIEAIRFFKGVVNDPSCRYSYADLAMYDVGCFDRETGLMDSYDPVLVENGKELFEGV